MISKYGKHIMNHPIYVENKRIVKNIYSYKCKPAESNWEACPCNIQEIFF